MTFQLSTGRRRLIEYLISVDGMKAALTARVGFLASMANMKVTLTAGAVYLTSMVYIKVGLKNDEFEKGA